jgi:hypothetical protein
LSKFCVTAATAITAATVTTTATAAAVNQLMRVERSAVISLIIKGSINKYLRDVLFGDFLLQ